MFFPNRKDEVMNRTDSKSRRYTLSEVSYSHKPQEWYEYDHQPPKKPTQDPRNPMLKCKRLPDGRFQSATYYRSGNNEVDGIGHIDLEDDDFRLHRIKELEALVGTDRTPIVTHRFIYDADEFAQKNQPFNGRTEVYDAYLHKRVYEYNHEHRPMSVQRFDKDQQLYSSEGFVWDDLYVYPNNWLFFDDIHDVLLKFIPKPKPPKNPSRSRGQGKDRSEEAIEKAKEQKEEEPPHESESNSESERNPLPLTRGHAPPPPSVKEHFPETPEHDSEELPPVTRGQGPEVISADAIEKAQEQREREKRKGKRRTPFRKFFRITLQSWICPNSCENSKTDRRES